ncbi:hypothetical protein K2P56_02860 [Patescibacteria group bacterium]|nr:hypothetical protein [Patescibacteria group bacterium]
MTNLELPQLPVSPQGWPLKDLWDKYEEVAMHFNDLLIKLRIQALAGVAGITTLVSLFAKSPSGTEVNWEIAALVFCGLIFFWIAIAIIDLLYYNRLLWGAVRTILELENMSKEGIQYVKWINLSTNIRLTEQERFKGWKFSKVFAGPVLFYLLVLFVLLFGLTFAFCRNSGM